MRKTNTQHLSHMMTFGLPGVSGLLVQMFLVDAITRHAKLIAETPIEEVRKAFGENPLVHPDAWHAAAVAIHKEFQARLGSKG